MKPYSTLTVSGQAQRLRALAINALRCYDLDVTRLRLVTNDTNGIFRVDTRDGQKYILRVTLPAGGHTRDHITAEMDWLAALSRDTCLSVPQPLAAKDGSLFVEAATDGVPEPRLCAVFSWVPGKNLADDMSEANVTRMGELMAHLHNHALRYHPPAGLTLLQYDRVFPFPEPVIIFEERFSGLFPPERRAVYENAFAWAQQSIDRLKAGGEPKRILHGDLHQWNIRIARDILSPIDFEDLMMGWPVQDIATTLYYFPAETYANLRSAFQAGYTRHAAWPEQHPAEINSFIAARGLMIANFVLNDTSLTWSPHAEEFVERIEKRLRKLRD
jgi:Ser/Thr protein kinase RdoA (MazF antagonist)